MSNVGIMSLEDFSTTDIGLFVTTLLRHAERRSLGVDADILVQSAKHVRAALPDLSIEGSSLKTGEMLSALVLRQAVMILRSDGCCCQVSACEQAGHRFCSHCETVYDVQQFSKAILMEAVCRLDGAYNINAQQLLSVINNYWDMMESNLPQPN